MLGNTFGNIDENRILDVITNTMHTDDFLLLEVDLINNRSKEELREGFGSDDITTKFLLQPIVSFFETEKRKMKMKIDEYKLIVDVLDNTGDLPNSQCVITCVQFDSQKIEAIHSQKYDLESLTQYLYEKKLGLLKTYTEQNVCLLLLNKIG